MLSRTIKEVSVYYYSVQPDLQYDTHWFVCGGGRGKLSHRYIQKNDFKSIYARGKVRVNFLIFTVEGNPTPSRLAN